MIYQNQNCWSWEQCNLIIKRKCTDSTIGSYFQSLCPEIAFVLEKQQQFSFKAKLSMRQHLLYDVNIGFYWHKSHYLPKIDVQIDELTRKNIINANNDKKYEAELIAGYPVKANQTYFLQQVELTGKQMYELDNQTKNFTIQNIRFNETSFFHNVSFEIIEEKQIQESKTNSKRVLMSYLSSPINIDSRKNAMVKREKGQYISQKISRQQFEKKIILNIGNSICETKLEPSFESIYGSFEHFINYYSLSKIRGKLRHPFYIGFHFNQAFKIFYNREICANEIQTLMMMEKYRKQTNHKILLFYIRNTDKEEKNCTQGQKKIIPQQQQIFVKLQQQEMQYNKHEYNEEFGKQNKKKQEFVIVQNKRKKLLKNLLMSWGYAFIEIISEEQTPQEKLKNKWVPIPKNSLKSNYLDYVDKLANNQIKLEAEPIIQAQKPTVDIFHSQVFTLSKQIKKNDMMDVQKDSQSQKQQNHQQQVEKQQKHVECMQQEP